LPGEQAAEKLAGGLQAGEIEVLVMRTQLKNKIDTLVFPTMMVMLDNAESEVNLV
jgi:hypothetical protein